MKRRVDYDRIARAYDRRFASGGMRDTAHALQALERASPRGAVLEVGCGTGHFLRELPIEPERAFGLDHSAGMLRRAQELQPGSNLVQGDAKCLPCASSSFDLVYCVNAIHHFGEPQAFISEAYRILGCDGTLAIAGSDPRHRGHHWYLYDYFEGTYETDLERFPEWERLSSWMSAAGFVEVESRLVERIPGTKEGRDILSDLFLKKDSVSQLALLSDKAYAQGMRRIRAALEAAEREGRRIAFRTEILIHMLAGRKPDVVGDADDPAK
jgi:ubiquinone/menaquinone biosynthesis C-methylase UbiE